MRDIRARERQTDRQTDRDRDGKRQRQRRDKGWRERVLATGCTRSGRQLEPSVGCVINFHLPEEYPDDPHPAPSLCLSVLREVSYEGR